MTDTEIKKSVCEEYSKVARNDNSSFLTNCCGSNDKSELISLSLGYSNDELKQVPEGSNLGLGCGNPLAIASIKEGDTVLDLGSGAGFDAFLAAQQVGPEGRVIGIDMTPDMLERARKNAGKGNYKNVEFRMGEIENLPVSNNSVDLLISNCVINLSTDKQRVFNEAFRVLKPGGSFAVSDIVLLKELPDKIMGSVEAYAGCITGAILKEEYLEIIKKAGFEDVEIQSETTYPADVLFLDSFGDPILGKSNLTRTDFKDIAESLTSIKVVGKKRD